MISKKERRHYSKVRRSVRSDILKRARQSGLKLTDEELVAMVNVKCPPLPPNPPRLNKEANRAKTWGKDNRVQCAREIRHASVRMANQHGYEVRRETLNVLGYGTYLDYLNSELWKVIRAALLPADCRTCPGKAVLLHHQSYDLLTLAGVDTSKLIPLCWACHTVVEFTVGGHKRTFSDAVRKCDKMLKQPKKRRKAHPCRSRLTPKQITVDGNGVIRVET